MEYQLNHSEEWIKDANLQFHCCQLQLHGNKVLLEKLTAPQLAKKFPTFYGT